MKLLIAPNAFKESLSAVEISTILQSQFQKVSPKTQLLVFPLSDGGDGFIDVIAYHKQFKKFESEARVITGEHALVEYCYDQNSGALFVESARLIGLKFLPAPVRNIFNYDSFALGAYIKKILQNHESEQKPVQKVVIGVGGTATIDLGLGAAMALSGLKLELPLLQSDSHKVIQSIKNKGVRYSQIELILDVLIPVFADKDMVTEFGAQKGLLPEQMPLLRNKLSDLLEKIHNSGGTDYSLEKLGAGGGLAVGFDFRAPVKILHSSDFLWEYLGLSDVLPRVDLVVTSEGRLDSTSLLNKGTSVLISKCREFGKPLMIISGSAEASVRGGLERQGIKIFELKDYFNGSIEQSILRAVEGLQKCAGEILVRLK